MDKRESVDMQPPYDDEFDEKPETKQMHDGDFVFDSPDEDLSTSIPLNTPCIMFYLPSQREPLKLANIGLIILGRRDKHGKFTPTVDLTDHHGALLGVSRKHAKVVFDEGDFYVTDMGSTNGTWVNDRYVNMDDMVKLTAGDLLRLGHLIIYVGGCGSPL